MKNILIFILISIIVIVIFYTLNKKIKYLFKEDFTILDNYIDNKKDIDNPLIKYSTIEKEINNLQDIQDIHLFLNKLSESFYIKISDLYINNKLDIVKNINEILDDLLRKTNNIKLDNPIYCLIFYKYDIDNCTDIVSIGKTYSFIKLILLFPKYIEINNFITKRDNTKIFDKYFKKNNFTGKTNIYLLNNKYKYFYNKI